MRFFILSISIFISSISIQADALDKDLQITVQSVKKLDFISLKNGTVKSNEGNTFVELVVQFFNPSDSKASLNLEKLILEGNGLSKKADFVAKENNYPLSYFSDLKVNKRQSKTVKYYYHFPLNFEPANLILEGKSMINLNNGKENEILLDAENNPTRDPQQAKYEREIINEKNRWYIKDYFYPEGILQMEMYCSAMYPIKREGRYVRYYQNGNVEKESFYKNDVETGLINTFYENGNQKSVVSRQDYTSKFHHYFNIEGEDLLKDGNGVYFDTNKHGNRTWHKISDSLTVASYEITKDNADTIFFIAGEIPKPSGGMRAFYMGIQKSLRYPAEARRQGVQGKVFVQFIVNKEGKLEDITAVKGIGHGCDIAAEKAVRECAPWIPGEFEGQKVKVRMILPITFKLG